MPSSSFVVATPGVRRKGDAAALARVENVAIKCTRRESGVHAGRNDWRFWAGGQCYPSKKKLFEQYFCLPRPAAPLEGVANGTPAASEDNVGSVEEAERRRGGTTERTAAATPATLKVKTGRGAFDGSPRKAKKAKSTSPSLTTVTHAGLPPEAATKPFVPRPPPNSPPNQPDESAVRYRAFEEALAAKEEAARKHADARRDEEAKADVVVAAIRDKKEYERILLEKEKLVAASVADAAMALDASSEAAFDFKQKDAAFSRAHDDLLRA